MQTYLQIVQMIVSVVLIAFILMQSRGTGFTGTAQDQTTVFRTRRGIEKTLFTATLVLAVVFVLVSIGSVLAAGL